MAAKGDAEAKSEDAKGGKKKLIIIIVVVLALLAGAGWFFFVRGKGGAAEPEALPPPVPGEVLQLDPITINLAGGHFLKFGMALQAVEGGEAKPSGAKALDLAISEFSGKTIEELSSTEGRQRAKEELTARVKLAYLPHEAEQEEKEASPSPKESSSDEEGSGEGSSGEESSTSGSHKRDEELTAEEAIKKADGLTVQPDVYEVYFTEFVMQ